MASIDAAISASIAAELESAVYGRRADVVASWAAKLRVSDHTVYRLARKAGWKSGRERRIDRGDTRTDATREYLLMIVREIDAAKRRYGTDSRYITTTEGAMERIRRLHGIEPPCSVSNINRLLREQGLVRAEMKRPVAPIRLKSANPNHVHLVDASVCINYWFEPGLPMNIRPINTAIQMNKIEALQRIKQKVIRLAGIDHYSGAFYLKYVVAEGERTADFIAFLYEMWAQKDDPQYPFCGLPSILYTDKGSALNSAAAKNLFRALRVDFLTHEPGNPRAKGMIEGLMRIVQEQFESNLARFRPRDIGHLNQMAYAWARAWQARKPHSRHGNSRFDFWTAKITRLQLRYPPSWETCQALALRNPETRTVTAERCITWNRSKCYIGEFAPVGAKVEVFPDLWQADRLFVEYEDRRLELTIPRLDDAGFPVDAALIGSEFKRHKDTAAIRAVKEAQKIPLPDSIPDLEYETPRKSYRLTEGSESFVPAREIRISTVKFLIALATALGRPLTSAERQALQARYGDTAPRADLQSVAAELRAGQGSARS